MSPTSTSTNTSGTSTALNGNISYGNKSSSSKSNPAKAYQDVLTFKPIKEHQVVAGPLAAHLYSRGGTSDYSELTFKLLK